MMAQAERRTGVDRRQRERRSGWDRRQASPTTLKEREREIDRLLDEVFRLLKLYETKKKVTGGKPESH